MAKKYRVRYLKASPWVDAHRSSGRRQTRYGGEGEEGGGYPYLGKGPVHLDRGTVYTESLRRGTPLTFLFARTPTLSQWDSAARHVMGCGH